jgi:hypothetical protein
MKPSIREEKYRNRQNQEYQTETEQIEAWEIWKKYELGKEYQHKIDLQDRTDTFFRFYNGDQWHGVNAGDEDLPIANFIKPIVKYKVSTVCQDGRQAFYNPLEYDRTGINTNACEKLNSYFAKKWEKGKLESISWAVNKDAAVCGAGYVFFGEGADTEAGQIIDNINIMFADEKSEDIQSQKYIIIRERKFIKDVKAEALENGVPEDELDMIVSDEEYQEQLGEKQEQNYAPKDGKCISLLFMYKDKEGFVHVLKAVRNLIYRPDTVIRARGPEGEYYGGLTRYPVVNLIWESVKNSSRGCGEVEYMIPNQLTVNKTLARRAIAIKNTAFPKIAYNASAIQDPRDILKAGAKIGFTDGMGQGINSIIGYLMPAHTSPDAKNLTDEIIGQTRELAGAGDAATGTIDPTKASGAAIIAVRDQSALPLNEQVARYSQFVEDLAYLWFDMWRAYNPNGLTVVIDDPETGEEVEEFIPPEVLNNLDVNVRVDVSKRSAYDRYAQEQSLQNLFQMQAITFDEYVEALESDSVMPKGKLERILDRRGQMQQMQAQIEQLSQQNQQMQMILEQIAGQGAGPEQGMPEQGMPEQGMPMQGMPVQQNMPINQMPM